MPGTRWWNLIRYVWCILAALGCENGSRHAIIILHTGCNMPEPILKHTHARTERGMLNCTFWCRGHSSTVTCEPYLQPQHWIQCLQTEQEIKKMKYVHPKHIPQATKGMFQVEEDAGMWILKSRKNRTGFSEHLLSWMSKCLLCKRLHAAIL